MSAPFLCPIDSLPLSDAGASLICPSGHVYDKAAAGYVNLLPPGRKSNASAGDDAEMVRARAEFLALGLYSRIAGAVCEIVSGAGFVIDAGCGEGYYSNKIAGVCGELAGFDVSKRAVARAAKASKARGLSNVRYAAANIFAMPLPDGCADAVVSLFAPLPATECLRVLKPGGRVILAAAGKRHLYELKAAIYGEPRENNPGFTAPDGFEETDRRDVVYSALLPDNRAVRNLFTMTPYYYKTSPADAKKLDGINTLGVTVDVALYVWTKRV